MKKYRTMSFKRVIDSILIDCQLKYNGLNLLKQSRTIERQAL